MDNRSEIREFLTSRRNRLRPAEAGLPVYGGNRRVPGLRREEVALLAGVSVDYYIRCERGDLSGVSESVLHALARALQLDDAETAHLFDLARMATGSPIARAPRPRARSIRPTVQRVLDSITEAPAVLSNDAFDWVGANRLGRALFAPILDQAEPNSARFMFLNPDATVFYPDWDKVARDLVAAMRGVAGRNPYDKRFSDLVGELSTRSDEFRVMWASHNVRFHRSGVKRIQHPGVGLVELSYDTLELPVDDGLQLSVFTAEPGSDSAQKLSLLGSWVADEPPAGARSFPLKAD
ncbi:MAG: helix-turn-helix transcriptional regulator [Microbacteriaceae bacterium]